MGDRMCIDIIISFELCTNKCDEKEEEEEDTQKSPLLPRAVVSFKTFMNNFTIDTYCTFVCFFSVTLNEFVLFFGHNEKFHVTIHQKKRETHSIR